MKPSCEKVHMRVLYDTLVADVEVGVLVFHQLVGHFLAVGLGDVVQDGCADLAALEAEDGIGDFGIGPVGVAAVVIPILEVFGLLAQLLARLDVGILDAVDAVGALVQSLINLIYDIGVEAAGDRIVEVLAILVAGFDQAHFLKLGMPGAAGDVVDIVGCGRLYGGLIAAFALDGVLAVDPLAILEIGFVCQLHAVTDGALGHAAAALLGIILGAVDESLAAALAEGLGQVHIKLSGNKSVYFFIESHNKIPFHYNSDFIIPYFLSFGKPKLFCVIALFYTQVL